MSTPTPEARLYLADMRRAVLRCPPREQRHRRRHLGPTRSQRKRPRHQLVAGRMRPLRDPCPLTAHTARHHRPATNHRRYDRPRGGDHVTLLKACIQCGEPSNKSRCPQHRPKDHAIDANAATTGVGMNCLDALAAFNRSARTAAPSRIFKRPSAKCMGTQSPGQAGAPGRCGRDLWRLQPSTWLSSPRKPQGDSPPGPGKTPAGKAEFGLLTLGQDGAIVL